VEIFIMLSVNDGAAAQTATAKANYCGSTYGAGLVLLVSWFGTTGWI
jgi:hypothetical protein